MDPHRTVDPHPLVKRRKAAAVMIGRLDLHLLSHAVEDVICYAATAMIQLSGLVLAVVPFSQWCQAM